MDKIALINQISGDVHYLEGEYETKKLWGSNPDGDVAFSSLMEWLGNEDNIYLLEHMIKVLKDIKRLSP